MTLVGCRVAERLLHLGGQVVEPGGARVVRRRRPTARVGSPPATSDDLARLRAGDDAGRDAGTPGRARRAPPRAVTQLRGRGRASSPRRARWRTATCPVATSTTEAVMCGPSAGAASSDAEGGLHAVRRRQRRLAVHRGQHRGRRLRRDAGGAIAGSPDPARPSSRMVCGPAYTEPNAATSATTSAMAATTVPTLWSFPRQRTLPVLRRGAVGRLMVGAAVRG